MATTYSAEWRREAEARLAEAARNGWTVVQMPTEDGGQENWAAQGLRDQLTHLEGETPPPPCCPEFARTGSAHTEICPAFQVNDPARYDTDGWTGTRHLDGSPDRGYTHDDLLTQEADRREQHYIASTDVNGPTPHVTAQWTGDHLDEIVVSSLTGAQLTREQFTQAWDIAAQLRATRKACR